MKFTAHSRRAGSEKGKGSWRTFRAMIKFAATGLVTTAGRLVPGRAAAPGIKNGAAARCGLR